MSGAETARRRVVQRRIGSAETAAPKCPSPLIKTLMMVTNTVITAIALKTAITAIALVTANTAIALNEMLA